MTFVQAGLSVIFFLSFFLAGDYGEYTSLFSILVFLHRESCFYPTLVIVPGFQIQQTVGKKCKLLFFLGAVDSAFSIFYLFRELV